MKASGKMKRQVDLFKCWSLPKRPQSRELDASIEIQSEDSSTEFLETSSQSLETTQSLEPNLDKSPALQTSEHSLLVFVNDTDVLM